MEESVYFSLVTRYLILWKHGNIAQAVLKRFPSLVEESYKNILQKPQISRHWWHKWDYWEKKQIFGKWKNSTDESSCPATGSKKMCWGVKHFLPEILKGEYDDKVSKGFRVSLHILRNSK